MVRATCQYGQQLVDVIQKHIVTVYAIVKLGYLNAHSVVVFLVATRMWLNGKAEILGVWRFIYRHAET